MSKRKIAYARKTCIDPEEEGEALPFPPREIIIHTDFWFDRDYELSDELLGRGKFGEVKICTERSTGLRLAAKIVNTRTEPGREEVRKEIRLMSQLRHPKILQIYDAFETKRKMCIITELVEGGELFDRIVDPHFDLTERVAILFMRQIVDGIAFIHSQNILHLDMKPENIICVAKTGTRIKIIDFGLAMRYASFSSTKVIAGTIDFMSPEVCNYEDVTPATDMWSIGVICYVLVSGLSPFCGDDDADTICNILRVEFDFVAEEFDDVTAGCKDFIKRLLIKEPRKRMTAEECMKHSWLNKITRSQTRKHLSKKHHIKFFIRRKWKKVIKAVVALNRMKILVRQRRERELQPDVPDTIVPEGEQKIQVEPAVSQQVEGENDMVEKHTSEVRLLPVHIPEWRLRIEAKRKEREANRSETTSVVLSGTARRCRVKSSKSEGVSLLTPSLSCSSGYESSGSTKFVVDDEQVVDEEEQDEEEQNEEGEDEDEEGQDEEGQDEEGQDEDEEGQDEEKLSNGESLKDGEKVKSAGIEKVATWEESGKENQPNKDEKLFDSEAEEKLENSKWTEDYGKQENGGKLESVEKQGVDEKLENDVELEGDGEYSDENECQTPVLEKKEFLRLESSDTLVDGDQTDELKDIQVHENQTTKEPSESSDLDVAQDSESAYKGSSPQSGSVDDNSQHDVMSSADEVDAQNTGYSDDEIDSCSLQMEGDNSGTANVLQPDTEIEGNETESRRSSVEEKVLGTDLNEASRPSDDVAEREADESSGSESHYSSRSSTQFYCPTDTLDNIVSAIARSNSNRSNETNSKANSNTSIPSIQSSRRSSYVSGASNSSVSGQKALRKRNSSIILSKNGETNNTEDIQASQAGIRSRRNSRTNGQSSDYDLTTDNGRNCFDTAESKSYKSRTSLPVGRRPKEPSDNIMTSSFSGVMSCEPEPEVPRHLLKMSQQYGDSNESVQSTGSRRSNRERSTESRTSAGRRGWSPAPRISPSPVREINTPEKRRARIAAICGDEYLPPVPPPPPQPSHLMERVIPIEMEGSPERGCSSKWAEPSSYPTKIPQSIRGRVSQSPIREPNYHTSMSPRRDSGQDVNAMNKRRARIEAIIGGSNENLRSSDSPSRPPVHRASAGSGPNSASRVNSDEARHRRIAAVLCKANDFN